MGGVEILPTYDKVRKTREQCDILFLQYVKFQILSPIRKFYLSYYIEVYMI